MRHAIPPGNSRSLHRPDGDLICWHKRIFPMCRDSPDPGTWLTNRSQHWDWQALVAVITIYGYARNVLAQELVPARLKKLITSAYSGVLTSERRCLRRGLIERSTRSKYGLHTRLLECPDPSRWNITQDELLTLPNESPVRRFEWNALAISVLHESPFRAGQQEVS